MLLSDSEAFWLAMVHQELSGLLAGIKDSTGVIAKGSIRDALATQVVGFRAYTIIRDLAVRFGVARAAELVMKHDTDPITPPEDIVWGAGDGVVLTAEAYEAVRECVVSNFEQFRDAVDGAPAIANQAGAIVQRARNLLDGCIVGYAPSTPGVLYHVSTSGEPAVLGYVIRRDPGLYLTLLGLLGRHLPLPPLERMALAAAGFRDEYIGHDYCPTLASLQKPLGTFDPEGFLQSLEQFHESNCERPAWIIGEELTILHGNARTWSENLADAASLLEDRGSEPLGDSPDPDPGMTDPAAAEDGDPCNLTQHDTRTFSQSDSLQEVLSRIQEQMLELVGTIRVIDDEENVDNDQAMGMLQHDLEFFREKAAVAAARCRDNGLTAVAEMVLVASDATPLIDWNNPLQTQLHDYTATLADTLSGTFRKTAKVLSDARKVAYGELRLRELKWDEHGLPSPALTGWSRQNENIRAAIKVAIEQLNNGLPPYVVLSQLAPASEALLRQLAAKHLSAYQGLNPNGLLKELRNSIGAGPDDHRDKVTVSVAHTLNAFRNWVVHEADAEWARDHAAFFLNGLSLLVREV